MASIISIAPIPGNRSASQDKDGNVVYSASYSILTDDDATSELYVANHCGFNVGSSYNGMPIQSINIEESSDPRQWTLSLTYGKIKQESDPDPRNQPAVLSVSYENHQRPIDYDATGKPIVNTCGDAFSDYTMVDEARPVLTFKKNMSDFPWTVANTYSNKVNRDTIYGCEPGTLKFERVSGNQQYATVNGEEITYYDVTYEISYDPEGWNNKPVLNIGYRELVDGVKKNIQIDGKDITTPVLLDEDGKRAEEGTPPHLLTFKKYRDITFEPIFA